MASPDLTEIRTLLSQLSERIGALEVETSIPETPTPITRATTVINGPVTMNFARTQEDKLRTVVKDLYTKLGPVGVPWQLIADGLGVTRATWQNHYARLGMQLGILVPMGYYTSGVYMLHI